MCKKRDYLFLDQIERYNKVNLYFSFAVMHNLFPFSHCNATSLGFTEYKYKQGIVELSQLNTTKISCNSATSYFQIWLCGKKKPSNFKSKKKYMTIKFVSNGKINAKGFKALLTGESFQIPNKKQKQYPISFFSKSVPRNQSRERTVDKREHTSVVVFLQRSVLHRLKCAAQEVQAFLQYKIEIKMTK